MSRRADYTAPAEQAVNASTSLAWYFKIVAALLAGGSGAEQPACIGKPYEDASGTIYSRLIGQPILVYGADPAGLARALERTMARGVRPAIYIREMFAPTNDADNRGVVKAEERAKLDLAGIAIRAERKTIDKIVDKLSFLK